MLPPEDGLDPHDQLTWRERFRQVVVRPQLEAQDAVDLVVTRGHEDDGSPVARLAQVPADLDAVQGREADIQHHRHRPQAPDRGQSLGAVALHVHPEAGLGEVEALQLGDGSLVLDDHHQAPCLAHEAILAAPGPTAGVLTFPEHRPNERFTPGWECGTGRDRGRIPGS